VLKYVCYNDKCWHIIRLLVTSDKLPFTNHKTQTGKCVWQVTTLLQSDRRKFKLYVWTCKW